MKITFITVRTEDKNFYNWAIVDYGYFATVPELIQSINAAMAKEIGSENKITFTFNPRTEKTGVTLASSYYVMLFGKLSAILGYGGRHIKIRKSTESTYVADLFGITSIFVYCDIVQPQIVGDISVPLLRTGALITKTFTNILHVPVQKKSFEDIVIATLYFRKQGYFS